MNIEAVRNALVEQVRTRGTDSKKYWGYYRNEQKPPAIKTRYSTTYKLLKGMAPNPLARLVVDTLGERLKVTGVRLDAPQADTAAWQVWQANRLDERQALVYREALVADTGYVMVAPQRNGGVRIVPESSKQVAVKYEAGGFNDVEAALKLWVDKVNGKGYCTLYTATNVYKYVCKLTTRGELPAKSHLASDGDLGWKRRVVPGEDWGARHGVNGVPVVPFPNRSTLDEPGRSELADVTNIIDRIDKFTLDLLLASETSAFAQRYITGAERQEDENGNPLPATWAMDKVLLLEEPTAKVGQLLPAPLDNYLKAIDAEVAMLAAVTRVPAHYLYTNSLANPPSADSQQASESGLIYKVGERQATFGESWEQVLRLALPLSGHEATPEELDRIETVWAPANNPAPSQLADLAVKAKEVGVPREALWEMLGATPQQIARWRTMSAGEALEALANAPVGLLDTGEPQDAPEDDAS